MVDEIKKIIKEMYEEASEALNKNYTDYDCYCALNDYAERLENIMNKCNMPLRS